MADIFFAYRRNNPGLEDAFDDLGDGLSLERVSRELNTDGAHLIQQLAEYHNLLMALVDVERMNLGDLDEVIARPGEGVAQDLSRNGSQQEVHSLNVWDVVATAFVVVLVIAIYRLHSTA
ncbi:uncharacterized protein Z520_09396 [Fonsecaea multimorphosa CBS 102226]|uniref:Uncharacterized protein n=1 Tax=Fonsecaea multimorphosa CBS 102226 TaxID=1442371 RepID=A0A0D2IC34_9EURO|nr:uncharacterized protein Z520_09396 [Fonsecaea multimorphosa CBS 102226]KIX94706.1 hypothetical protein Z520_09396 [Fonsecaea multimorphosa CBS 102226]OAL20481.1 hypothetical protein AYO22_08782 [Fonsecaea multimorphosa]